jgi:hypothetical protein
MKKIIRSSNADLGASMDLQPINFDPGLLSSRSRSNAGPRVRQAEISSQVLQKDSSYILNSSTEETMNNLLGILSGGSI